jgi:methylthioribose-1-phosphate isomerase
MERRPNAGLEGALNMRPALEWKKRSLVLIDQRKLPVQEVYVVCRTYIQVAQAIEKMVVRGAPAIGVAAAYGLCLGMMSLRGAGVRSIDRDFGRIYRRLEKTRPTARNLFWALERMKRVFDRHKAGGLKIVKERLCQEAQAIEREDAETNRMIGFHGRELIFDGDAVLTHCNAGALATAAYGTALGIIRAAAEQGKKILVYADETRPLLQGARLTVWELMQDGIPTVLITDNMAGSVMRKGLIRAVFVGADRIARNGDTANKIGTYMLAVLAKENDVPFYVAAPRSTIDVSLADGDAIPIEERKPGEVREIGGRRITVPDVEVYNPAFDITPAKYIKAIVTERGICRPPYTKSLVS